VETITVVASRGFTVSDMEMLIGSGIVIASLAWMMVTKMKYLRSREHQPRVDA
jgi:hypothetical protein